MSEFTLIKDYKVIDEYRLSFNRLANQTFGIDFEGWYQRGCWNDRYICYSFLSNERVIANLSVSLMDIVIDDSLYSAVQIGTVMTEKGYRNRGLSRKLMEIAMEEYQSKCSFMYLYANKSVLDFYPKFGFKKVKEPNYSINIDSNDYPTSHYKVRKLNISSDKNDWDLLMKLYSSRRALSKKCNVMNAEGIFSWYCINIFSNDIYLIEELKTIIIYQKEGDTIHLYDVILNNEIEIELDLITGTISNMEVDKVIFHFMPVNGDYIIDFSENPDDTLFILPIKINDISNIKFPKIAQA
jgi:GNAT superfamily N-acetyltransferase